MLLLWPRAFCRVCVHQSSQLCYASFCGARTLHISTSSKLARSPALAFGGLAQHVAAGRMPSNISGEFQSTRSFTQTLRQAFPFAKCTCLFTAHCTLRQGKYAHPQPGRSRIEASLKSKLVNVPLLHCKGIITHDTHTIRVHSRRFRQSLKSHLAENMHFPCALIQCNNAHGPSCMLKLIYSDNCELLPCIGRMSQLCRLPADFHEVPSSHRKHLHLHLIAHKP